MLYIANRTSHDSATASCEVKPCATEKCPFMIDGLLSWHV